LPYAVIDNQFHKYVSTDGKFETRKKAQEKEVKSWQPDRQTICAALFYDNLLDKYIETQELRDALL
jgi:hypothetical protein